MRTGRILAALVTIPLALGAAGAQSGSAPDRTPSAQFALAKPSPSMISLPSTGSGDATAARSAIEQANASWLAAFRDADAGSLARIYTPDASVFPPSNVSLEGRDRIVEYFAAQRKAGMGDASLKTLDVVCVGDVAYEVGTYRFGFDNGETASGDAGRYFAIWKAQPDGAWRYHVGIWSSNRDVDSRR